MIAYIKGRVVERLDDSVLLDHNGIAFQIYMSKPMEVKLNTEIQVFTYQHVREDALMLFGFSNSQEKSVFMEVINVKGIGPKTAMNILSKTDGNRFIQAIEQEDIEFLKTLPGIGKKTASQILLDLKGKFVSIDHGLGSEDSSDPALIDEALAALKELGFKQSELRHVEKSLAASDIKDIDGLIKLGLRKLALNGGR